MTDLYVSTLRALAGERGSFEKQGHKVVVGSIAVYKNHPYRIVIFLLRNVV